MQKTYGRDSTFATVPNNWPQYCLESLQVPNKPVENLSMALTLSILAEARLSCQIQLQPIRHLLLLQPHWASLSQELHLEGQKRERPIDPVSGRWDEWSVPIISTLTSFAKAINAAPAAKKMSATLRADFLPYLSLQRPPPAEPKAAPATAALTINPWIQCNLPEVNKIYHHTL